MAIEYTHEWFYGAEVLIASSYKGYPLKVQSNFIPLPFKFEKKLR